MSRAESVGLDWIVGLHFREGNMGTMSEVATPIAAKEHRCSWCGERIPVGECYRRYRYWQYGEAGTAKLHAECFETMQDCAEDEGGWIEWTPYDQERPQPNAQAQADAACGVSPGAIS